MDITKINSNSMNFGNIKKSAVEVAIREANGNLNKLSRIKDAIEKQKNNPYDIKGLPSHEYYNYIVVKQGKTSGMSAMTLEEACQTANTNKQIDELVIKAEMRKNQQKPEFEKMAKELLDSCEE